MKKYILLIFILTGIAICFLSFSSGVEKEKNEEHYQN